MTLSAVQDATLYQDPVMTTANGSGPAMVAGNTNFGNTRRALVAFDFSQIPPTSVINEVTLRLTVDKTSAGPQTVSIHDVLSSWGEGISHAGEEQGKGTAPATGDATWLHRRFDTQTWDSPGGDFVSSATASTVVDGIGQYTWSSQDMVHVVQDWVDIPDANFGWLIRGNESGRQTAKRFHTSETANPANRPTLIVDFDPADVIKVAVAGVSGPEGDTSDNSLDFEFSLSKAAEIPVTIQYETRPGTATEGEDYSPASGQLVFNPGDPLTKSVSVLVHGDLIDEFDESFFVKITGTTGADFVGPDEAEGIITDDDPFPLIEIEDVSVDEGDDGLTIAELSVSLSIESAKQVLVFYETSDDTATEENLDYVSAFGQVVFAPGVIEQSIEIQIQGDIDPEGDEQLRVNLLNPVNAEIADEFALVAIVDDDPMLANSWHNASFPQDVDGDGAVVPLDALLVINRLNRDGPGALPVPPVEPDLPPPYVDVSGDNFLAPIDALLVINRLNNPPPAAAKAFSPQPLDAALNGERFDKSAQLAAAAVADEEWLRDLRRLSTSPDL